MSRFDPEKVKWPDTTTRGPRLVGGVATKVEAVVPANAYRELYESAEQMAEVLDRVQPYVGWKGDPHYELVREALANYREGES
jgi:hypothetical protein